MKLILILALEQSGAIVPSLLAKAGIGIFSHWPIEGVQLNLAIADADNWFGGHKMGADSTAFISLCSQEQASSILSHVALHNINNNNLYPLHAVQLGVETVI